MTLQEQVTEVLHQARVRGGWVDEDVAAEVLKLVGLNVPETGAIEGEVLPPEQDEP